MQPQRLQSFLRESARARSEPVASGPFDCFFTPADPLVFLNYAIPREPVGAAAAAAALPELEAVFAARDRVPRFEFVAAFAPELAGALERCGYCGEPGTFAMSCERGALRVPALDAPFELALHDDCVSDAEIRATLRVRDEAFGMPHDEPGTDAIAAYRASARLAPRAVVRKTGEVVAVGALTSAWDGVAEIAGIGVQAGMRRRGLGGAITAFLASRAFASGIERIHLTAGDAAAASVYARVGFRPATHAVLAYIRNPA